MRIISGYLKGRKINQPDDINTRPLKDLTKESIFNILQHSNLFSQEFKNSIILDLFSGVGSFGLECISRGAAQVTFCENYPPALKILKENIVNLDCEDKVKILNEDIIDLKNLTFFPKEKFDIIFLDPPYKEKKINPLIQRIINLKILKDNGIIIIHRHKKELDAFPKNFTIKEIKTYGISKIIFGN